MSTSPVSRKRVLVTGAAGRIGAYFAEHSHSLYDLRLMVRNDEEAAKLDPSWGEIVTGELDDLAGLKEIFRGCHTVLHLAANPDATAVWRELLETNIIGTYHAFVAAKAAGCQRVIYASSIHAVSGYPIDVQVKTNEPVNPGDIYGVTKCFGEALGRYMAEQEGLPTIALRIGAFQPRENARSEKGLAMLDAFVSRRDLNQLINRCIAAEQIRFAILHGLSNNSFKRLDISDARALVGYAPQDDAASENPELAPLNLSRELLGHNIADENARSGIREDV